MEKINWFSGMEVFNVDLNQLQSYFENRIDMNMSSFTNKGVIVPITLPNGITLNPPYVWSDTKSLGVYGLVAYNEAGQIILVAPAFQDGLPVPTVSNLTPENVDGTGKLIPNGHPYKADVEFYIVIRYAESFNQDELRIQDGTGIKLPVRIETGFELYSRPTNGILDGDVVLAKITTDTLGNITVDETERDTFSIVNTMIKSSIKGVSSSDTDTSNVTLEDHINMLGTGQWNIHNPHAISAQDLGIDPTATGKHQFYLHSDGIKTDNMFSTNSAFYPYYLSSSLTSEERLIISPLSEELNEIVVVHGDTLNSKNFPDPFIFDFSPYASEENTGYYLFVIDSTLKGITRLGPYQSEDDPIFLSDLQNRLYFPICSLYWGTPKTYLMEVTIQEERGQKKIICSSEAVFSSSQGSITAKDFVAKTGDTPGSLFFYDNQEVEVLAIQTLTPNMDSFDIDPLSFRDRRVFNNTSFKDIQPQDLCAIRDSAPFYNDTVKLYNARVVANSKNSYYSLGGSMGTTFHLIVDNINYPVYTFVGEEDLSINQVIEQLNTYLSQNYSGAGNRPVAVKNWDGKISILAEHSISVQPGTANEILGFDINFNNMSDSGDDIKCIITDGQLASRQEIYYTGNGLVENIYYITTGNYLRKHSITYNAEEFINSITETVQVMES